jgi:cysteinyl-tRNA synthetase
MEACGVTIRITDSATGKKRDFHPVQEGRVGMYVCGMTVQDRPHVGHMRAAIVGDAIRRYLIYRGYEVTFLTNFTDIDDKIIARAQEEGVDYQDVAERNIQAYFDVADKLNIMRATIYPKATEHIDDIVAMIEKLIDRGLAYARGGDVYYRVAGFRGYGKLSGRRIDELQAGARIEVGEDKEDPLDFTLWKAAKPGEPAWQSPWGDGRPGWHIECSAMSTRYLGENFDIHGGGMDLIFPHHENEIAQSEGATGKPFVNFWVHNGMVNLTGEKMSKSTKHFSLAEDVLATFPPPVVRFYLLSTHYRSPIEFSEKRLREAEQAYGRMAKALEEAERRRSGLSAAPDLGEGGLRDEVVRLTDAFSDAMDDDFNTAKAMGHLFEMARAINRALEGAAGGSEEAGQAVAAADRLRELSGVVGIEWPEAGDTDDVPADVRSLFEEREAARVSKNWARADELRDEITSLGFTIEDRPEGSRLVRTS